MRNILVTGTNGQLGSEIRKLSPRYTNYNYFFTDIQELDICDKEAVARYVSRNKIDVIVNCAAYTAVDNAEDHKALCVKLNSVAPGYLAAAIQVRSGVMIHISTDYVFDGTNHLPYKEEERTCPVSVYGVTKLAGEVNAMENCDNTVIIRTAWLYSAFGSNFVKSMLRLGKEKEQLGVVFDQIGTPTYARDLAGAIFTIIGQQTVSGIYHFSNEGACSWYDFAKSVHRIAGIDTCKVFPLHAEDYPAKAARPHYSVLDKSKIKSTFGIEIPHWEESLQECIKQLNEE